MCASVCVCESRARHNDSDNNDNRTVCVLYANRFWTKAKVIHEIFKSVIQFLLSIMMILYFLLGFRLSSFFLRYPLRSVLLFFFFPSYFLAISALAVCCRRVCCYVPKIEYPSWETFQSNSSVGINSLSSHALQSKVEHLDLSIALNIVWDVRDGNKKKKKQILFKFSSISSPLNFAC